jgi:hypothetical protein
MKVPEKYYDEIFPFAGQWDMPSACGLKIIHKNGKTYIITTELYQENPGTSITYAGGSLIKQICEQKKLDMQSIIYIECNPNTNSKLSFYDEEMFEVSYDIVDNMPTNLSYRQLSKEEIQNIVE